MKKLGLIGGRRSHTGMQAGGILCSASAEPA